MLVLSCNVSLHERQKLSSPPPCMIIINRPAVSSTSFPRFPPSCDSLPGQWFWCANLPAKRPGGEDYAPVSPMALMPSVPPPQIPPHPPHPSCPMPPPFHHLCMQLSPDGPEDDDGDEGGDEGGDGPVSMYREWPLPSKVRRLPGQCSAESGEDGPGNARPPVSPSEASQRRRSGCGRPRILMPGSRPGYSRMLHHIPGQEWSGSSSFSACPA